MKKIFRFKYLYLFSVGILFSGLACADSTFVSLTTIASTVDSTVANLATVLVDVAIIAGIGFVMASFFKFHQHKQNPQQVQLTQGISLMLIGAGLTLIPLLIPTASVSVLGTAGSNIAKVGGTAIQKLIN